MMPPRQLRSALYGAVLGGLLTGIAPGARAQGLDCATAQAGIERALICASAQSPQADAPVTRPAPATLDHDHFPTAGRHDTLLHVNVPGRFAIRAASATDTVLQLVDMMTGPGERTGPAPGQTDTRIDALLDAGTYKLRAFGDKAATGETRLTVTAFADMTPPLLAPGYAPATLALTDLHQQSFWYVVDDPADDIRIEAAGRSVADIRVWQNGRDLVEIPAQRDTIAPVAAHPMARYLLSGHLPAGSYLVTIYGGPALKWSDGAEDQPLLIRTGHARDLLAGGGDLSIGPFGREVYAVPPNAADAQVRLPAPADLSLRPLSGDSPSGGASMSRKQRAATAMVALGTGPAAHRFLEVSAAVGTAFNLRAVPRRSVSVSRGGDFWFSSVELGRGGDEVPAAALLTRMHRDGSGDVLASPGVPEIGPAKAWRVRFNYRGQTSLLFHVVEATTVAVKADGPPVEARITTIERHEMNATGDGRAAKRWSLSPGWYQVVLDEPHHAEGILDLTLGPPDLNPAEPAPPGPADPFLLLGLQSVGTERLRLSGNEAPGERVRPIARATPVELADGPMALTLAPGQSESVNVHVATAGTLITRDLAGGAPLEQRELGDDGYATVELPASDHARTLVIGLLPPEPAAPMPSPEPPPDLPALADGAASFLDLGRDRTASFSLQLAQGGLFRATTLGRLHTASTIGTSFVPTLDSADGNGVGANMLLQRYLRAGRYRLNVTAHGSAGRVGVAVAPASLAQGAPLLPGLSVRASLPAGTGVAFPIQIAEEGDYHLDLRGLGGRFAARLEDAEGWPLLADGDLTSLDTDLAAGSYRLIVQPPSVAARAVARLTRILPPPPPIRGHGPHPLPFEAAQSATWREPAGVDDARAPDVWRFALAGPASVTLDLAGAGMQAVLRPDAPGARPLGHVEGGASLARSLPAGRYVVEARAAVRNDRVDYRLTLHSDELQPAVPRVVELPSVQSFAIAAPRVVSVTSFGDIPLRAVLRAEDGMELARVAERTDDWNIALTRPLPAGRYRLELSALAAPDSSDSGDQTDAPAPQVSSGSTEVTLALADEMPEESLATDGSARLAGVGVHRLTLPAAAPGTLALVAAESPIEITLAVEARAADGAWRRIGQDQGIAPIVAIPGDGGAWRALVWSVDGADAPIRLATTATEAEPQPLGAVTFRPAGLAGLATPWAVAKLADPGAATLDLAWPDAPLLATTGASEAAGAVTAVDPGRPVRIYATAETVWLVARQADAAHAGSARTADLPGDRQTGLDIPPGGRASFPMSMPAGSATCAVIASAVGQPGLQAGRGMGVASGSALALCGGDRLAAWNAGGADPLRLTLRRETLALLPARPLDTAFTGTLPAHTALPLRLPAGGKRVDASLAAGSALVADWTQPGALTMWAGDAPLTRDMTGEWTDLLAVNTTDAPVPVAVTALPTDPVAPLAGGAVSGRFFGADGSFVLPLKPLPGQRLLIAGDAFATVLRADGQVREGTDLPLGDGAATAIVTHRTGAVAAWLEGAGASPWAGVPAQPVTLPAHLVLGGKAMVLRLKLPSPALVNLRSSAPLILAAGDGRPALFGQGATQNRYMPAGETVLRLLSPQDGPLTGAVDLSATPVTELAEGVGAPVEVGPGGAALFGFRMIATDLVGLGVRADPDTVAVRLLDESGRELDHGVTLMRRLRPGHYLIEATVPPDAPTTMLRPAVIGTLPHPTPPPRELVRDLMLAAGLVPPDAAR